MMPELKLGQRLYSKPVTTPLGVLNRMSDVLKTYGWGQRHMVKISLAHKGGVFCLSGAACVAAGERIPLDTGYAQLDGIWLNIDDLPEPTVVQETYRLLAIAIAGDEYEDCRRRFSSPWESDTDIIVEFNDHQAKTRADVLKVINKAKQLAKQRTL